MTMRGVDFHQIVEVNHGQTVGMTGAFGLLMVLLQQLLEGAQVQQAGQRVGCRQIADLLLGALHVAHQYRNGTGGNQHRRHRADQTNHKCR
jgi:hypothetical protein